jgi:hypothetical protein
MSNKTIFKRVALVAVTALGAGVLSVAPANAAAPDNNAVGAASISTTENVLNIATSPSITGDAITDSSDATLNKSRGLLANSTTQTTSSLTSTATVSSSSEVVWYTTSAAAGTGDPIVTFVVEGATITEAESAATTKIFSQDLTMYSVGTEDGGGQLTAIGVTPKSGVTSYTLSMYTTTSTENALAAPTAAQVGPATIISGAQSKGTLVQRYLVTVATTSVSGVYSAADSYFAGAACSTADAQETNVDATDSLSINNGVSPAACININLRDAYNVSLAAKGALIITATNGAGIGYKDDGSVTSAASEFNLTQVSSTSADGKITVVKPAARVNKSFSTTVSVSWNGVVVSTKSVTFKGEVATVTASAPKIGALNASNAGAFKVAYADDAGNALYPTASDTSVVSSTTNSIVTGASVPAAGSSAELALGTLVCANVSTGGTADLQLQHVNSISGTVVKSNVWKATCAGNADTYTASFDKASYTPGSLATLTITFKDVKGQLANAYDLVGNGALITIAGAPNATAVTIPAATDKPDTGAGTKTYQFVVGTTQGDFQAVVSVPDVNALNGANQTVPYSVKSAVSTVTNEEILKSIVSLIASINKQIQALQKLILRR